MFWTTCFNELALTVAFLHPENEVEKEWLHRFYLDTAYNRAYRSYSLTSGGDMRCLIGEAYGVIEAAKTAGFPVRKAGRNFDDPADQIRVSNLAEGIRELREAQAQQWRP